MSPSTKEGSTASKEDLGKHIQYLYNKINSLEEAKNNSGHHAKIKAPKPDTYEGSREGVQTFLTQLSAYLYVNNDSFTNEGEKVMCAGGLLRGRAAEWFEPYLRDYLDNNKKTDRKDETNALFGDFDYFTKALRNTFGNPDELRTAERQLMQLKQRGSAGTYVADFQRIAARVDWGEQALIVCFYNGLRDDVKDELSREARPTNLATITNRAIRIDNRLYERRLEKKGQGIVPWGSRQANTGRYRSTASGHHPGPMELDAAHREGKPKGNCYNCGKPGHYANKCRQPKKQWKPVPERGAQVAERSELPERNVSTAIAAPSRGSLRWSDPLARAQQYQDMEQPEDDTSESSSSSEDQEEEEEEHMPPFLIVPGWCTREASTLLAVLENAFDPPEQDERLMYGDSPLVHPQENAHDELSWTSCVFATCEHHLWEKIEARWFVRRSGNGPLSQPYQDTELLGWREHSRTKNHLFLVPLSYGRSRGVDAEVDWHIRHAKERLDARRPVRTLPRREETNLQEMTATRVTATLRPAGPEPPRYTEQDERAIQAQTALNLIRMSGNDRSRL